MSFYNPTELYCGSPNFEDLLGSSRKKALLVTDPYMVKSGTYQYVTEPLHAMGIDVIVFSDIVPDPTIDEVVAGVDVMLAESPDVLVALGGGSAIDTAKAILYFSKKAGCQSSVFFLVIPTTSGTGSEMTSFSVITDPKNKQKYELIDDSMLPQASVLDPELTVTVPPKVTADTGIDVLTHAIEAFVSPLASDFTDACAEKAVQLINRFLLTTYHQPRHLKARASMHHASCLAGMAFNHASLGINHSLAHAIGPWACLSHGRTNGILLPYVIAFNSDDRGRDLPPVDRYAELAVILKCSSDKPRQATRNLIREIARLKNNLDIPESFQEAGIPESDFLFALDDLAMKALNDRCTPGNPVEVTVTDLKNVLLNAYYGRWR